MLEWIKFLHKHIMLTTLPNASDWSQKSESYND